MSKKRVNLGKEGVHLSKKRVNLRREREGRGGGGGIKGRRKGSFEVRGKGDRKDRKGKEGEEEVTPPL